MSAEHAGGCHGIKEQALGAQPKNFGGGGEKCEPKEIGKAPRVREAGAGCEQRECEEERELSDRARPPQQRSAALRGRQGAITQRLDQYARSRRSERRRPLVAKLRGRRTHEHHAARKIARVETVSEQIGKRNHGKARPDAPEVDEEIVSHFRPQFTTQHEHQRRRGQRRNFAARDRPRSLRTAHHAVGIERHHNVSHGGGSLNEICQGNVRDFELGSVRERLELAETSQHDVVRARQRFRKSRVLFGGARRGEVDVEGDDLGSRRMESAHALRVQRSRPRPFGIDAQALRIERDDRDVGNAERNEWRTHGRKAQRGVRKRS